jgi:hypothetical protein
MTDNRDTEIARQGRTIAITIALSGLLSIFAPGLVRLFSLAPRFEILFYLISLGAFFWALVVTWRLWQKTRD